MLYKMVLTFESVDKILNCDHSNESHGAVVCFSIYFAVQGGYLVFEAVDKILKCDHPNESY